MKKFFFLQPVILCGGFGSRLWPLSKTSLPKQFVKMFDGKSLFELTIERLKYLKNSRDPIIITSEKYKYKIEGVLLEKNIQAKVILEPVSRNTAAAVFFSSYFAHKDDLLLIMPSDHFIPNINEFIKMINFSIIRMDEEKWVVFGVNPQKPSTAYGHIKVDKNDIQNKLNNNKIYKVLQFIEKPNLKVAKNLFLTKEYLFNSGIFLVKKETALKSIYQKANDLYMACQNVIEQTSIENVDRHIHLNYDAFKRIPSISIDYAVLEKENEILCCSFNSIWNDIGSWDSYFDTVNREDDNNQTIEINGTNNILVSKDRMIATVGVDDLMIIDTQNTTLITKRDNSDNLKTMVEALIKDRSPYIDNIFYEERPWGNFEVLFDSSGYKVKKLTVLPNRRLSLQYHKKRSEHWFVVSGIADVYIDGNEFKLNIGDSMNVKKESKHFIANYYDQDLIVIEIQIGEYFGEDDIVRLDDPYDRK